MPREIEVSEAAFSEIKRDLEAGKAVPLPKRPELGNCTLQALFGPDGNFNGYNCTGRCGFFDRFFGRSCQKVTRGTPDGGVAVACTCVGGWFDRLIR